jgi:hypothetical protein
LLNGVIFTREVSLLLALATSTIFATRLPETIAEVKVVMISLTSTSPAKEQLDKIHPDEAEIMNETSV